MKWTLTFDPKRPVASCKALVLDLMKGYRFDVEGLYLKGGTIRPLPSEAAVVGKVLEVTIHEHLSRKLLQARQLKSIPASSDRVYPDVSFNGPMIFPHKFALNVKCARRMVGGTKTECPVQASTRALVPSRAPVSSTSHPHPDAFH